MMAHQKISSVNITAATDNMSLFPAGNALYPDYLRYQMTTGNYSSDATGMVTQVSTGFP
ncbi:MAG: hypothetical protein ABID71_09990 [Chloroflexota bacterium]